MDLKIINLKKKYGDTVALKDINLNIKSGEFICIVGPSGCGKTTLLRIIAGILKQDDGQIFIGDNEISSLPIQKRNTALVFQNYALFPHLNVEENIGYGLKIKGYGIKERNIQVKDALNIVKLKGYEKHRINEISGGQQQRVALARALIIKPQILLFDEPLSNLDEKLRVSMRNEIKLIQRELNITTIYVTHDQQEALSIADRIVLMKDGAIEQVGSPDEIYHNPVNTYVASFIGQANLYNTTVYKDGLYNKINLFNSTFIIPNIQENKIETTVMIRPEEIELSKEGYKGTVKDITNLGNILRYTIEVEDGNEVIIDTLNRLKEYNIKIGTQIFFNFSKNSLKIINGTV